LYVSRQHFRNTIRSSLISCTGERIARRQFSRAWLSFSVGHNRRNLRGGSGRSYLAKDSEPQGNHVGLRINQSFKA
jgi:hypothetical protein